jgi:hypothetical protein
VGAFAPGTALSVGFGVCVPSGSAGCSLKARDEGGVYAKAPVSVSSSGVGDLYAALRDCIMASENRAIAEAALRRRGSP